LAIPDQTSTKERYIKETPDKTPRPPLTNKNFVVQPVPVALGDVDVKKPLERIEEFFSVYSEFQYRPGNSSVSEFNRLCKEYRWDKDGPHKKYARRKFNLAMKQEFDTLYGSDVNDINNWHKLCYILRIDPVPNTLEECRLVSS
jgi:hypothetical protein